MRTAVTALLFLSVAAISTAHASSKMEVDGDGGYSGVVVKIADDGSVPEDKCSEILDNIRVSTNESTYQQITNLAGEEMVFIGHFLREEGQLHISKSNCPKTVQKNT